MCCDLSQTISLPLSRQPPTPSFALVWCSAAGENLVSCNTELETSQEEKKDSRELPFITRESSRLEETFKIIVSNCELSTAIPTLPASCVGVQVSPRFAQGTPAAVKVEALSQLQQ